MKVNETKFNEQSLKTNDEKFSLSSFCKQNGIKRPTDSVTSYQDAVREIEKINKAISTNKNIIPPAVLLMFSEWISGWNQIAKDVKNIKGIVA